MLAPTSWSRADVIYHSENIGTINAARKAAGVVQANIPALQESWSWMALGCWFGEGSCIGTGDGFLPWVRGVQV